MEMAKGLKLKMEMVIFACHEFANHANNCPGATEKKG